MKILLINNNPVVNKLVTLSVQKTSDELDKVEKLEDIDSTSYDLVIVDDGVYSGELFDELKSKVKFSKSLYICAKDAKAAEGFNSTIHKPFLPTDLVETLVS
ncbi:MAG: DNA topoisomerase IV, partial [Sulfurimonas sp.]